MVDDVVQFDANGKVLFNLDDKVSFVCAANPNETYCELDITKQYDLTFSSIANCGSSPYPACGEAKCNLLNDTFRVTYSYHPGLLKRLWWWYGNMEANHFQVLMNCVSFGPYGSKDVIVQAGDITGCVTRICCFSGQGLLGATIYNTYAVCGEYMCGINGQVVIVEV